MFGTSEIDEFNVHSVFSALTLLEEDHIFEFNIEMDDAILMKVHKGTEKLFDDFADKLLPVI